MVRIPAARTDPHRSGVNRTLGGPELEAKGLVAHAKAQGPQERESGNVRKGTRAKTVLTYATGEVELEVLTALALTSSSIFFGMVLILLDSNRSGVKPGMLQHDVESAVLVLEPGSAFGCAMAAGEPGRVDVPLSVSVEVG